MNEPIHLLYVDDYAMDRELVRDALEREHGSFQVTEAASRAEFEARLAEAEYDLVLSDFNILGFEGLEVIDALAARAPSTPVVIVTGTGSEEIAVEAMKRGAADYVIKTPHHIRRLPATILAVLERKRLRQERCRAEASERFLARAGSMLASSIDDESVLAQVVRLAVPDLADACVVQVRQEGEARQVVAAAVDPAVEGMLSNGASPSPGPSPRGEGPGEGEASDAPRSPLPAPRSPLSAPRSPRGEGEAGGQILPEVPDSVLAEMAGNAGQLDLLRRRRPRSAMVVPLVACGRSLGALYFLLLGDGRRYDRADLALAEELARRIALAVDNARLYREARRAIRLRDDFLAVAAHELKTPLTSLQGFAQVAARYLEGEGCGDPARLHRAMEVITQQCKKLDRLVAQLLDLPRLEAGRLTLDLQPVDIARLAEAVVEAARRLGAHRHPITVAAPSPVWTMADPLRLELVVANLIDNAVRYSPLDSPIEVEVSMPAPGAARLDVRDRGIGIPPEHRNRIFDRFYRAHVGSNREGLGLGLYTSRHIVLLHGGRIEVEFPPDGGTRFVVTLPREPGGAADPCDEQERADE